MYHLQIRLFNIFILMIKKEKLRNIDININQFLHSDQKLSIKNREEKFFHNLVKQNDHPHIDFKHENQEEKEQKSVHYHALNQNQNPYAIFVEEDSPQDILEVSNSQKKEAEDAAIVQNDVSLSSKDKEKNVQSGRHSYFTNAQPCAFFFTGCSNTSITKLLCFDLTNRNSKYVIYNHLKMTCSPIYSCFGCGKTFKASAALGGHLSKCHFKKKHEIIMAKNKEESNPQKPKPFINQGNMMTRLRRNQEKESQIQCEPKQKKIEKKNRS